MVMAIEPMNESTSFDIPGADAVVLAAAKKILTICTKNNRTQPVVVAFQMGQTTAIGQIPKANHGIVADAGEARAVGADRNGSDPGSVVINLIDLSACG